MAAHLVDGEPASEGPADADDLAALHLVQPLGEPASAADAQLDEALLGLSLIHIFQQRCTSPVPKPSHLPVQFHELPSVAKPYSRPAKEVKALKVEAAMNWPDTTLLFRGA